MILRHNSPKGTLCLPIDAYGPFLLACQLLPGRVPVEIISPRPRIKSAPRVDAALTKTVLFAGQETLLAVAGWHSTFLALSQGRLPLIAL